MGALAWAKMGVEFTGGETLGFCFGFGFVFEALAPQMLEVSASGGVAVYGYLLTAVGNAVGPVLDEGLGAGHGGIVRGQRMWWCGKAISVC